MYQKFLLSLVATVTLFFYSNTVQAQTAQQNIQIPTNTSTDASNLIPSTNLYPGDINQQGGIINNTGLYGQSNCGHWFRYMCRHKALL